MDRAVVEERTVAAIEVLDVIVALVLDDLRMVSANRTIIDLDIALWMSTDDDRLSFEFDFRLYDRRVGRQKERHN